MGLNQICNIHKTLTMVLKGDLISEEISNLVPFSKTECKIPVLQLFNLFEDGTKFKINRLSNKLKIRIILQKLSEKLCH